MEVTFRDRRERLTSALVTLLGALVLTPLAALVPPHIPWAILVLGVGLYRARRLWTGEHLVHDLQAACPSCGNLLKVKGEQYLKLPHEVPCFTCHQNPELQLAA